jgi:hypothetical protein
MEDDLFVRTGATESYQEGTSSEESSISFWADDQGRVTAAGFTPGAEVVVRLRGGILDELLAEGFVVMDAVGAKTVTLRTQGMPQRFVGVVRTGGGAPIDGAVVAMRVHESVEPRGDTSSGAEGRFEIEGIFALSVNIRIDKEGFVPFSQNDVPVPPAGAQLDFVLTPSYDVTIFLVDENGQLVSDPADITVVVPNEIEPQPYMVEPYTEIAESGAYLGFDLPPGPIQIQVTIGDTYVVSDHDSRQAVARILIPRSGTAEILWRRVEGDPPRCRIRIESEGGATFFQSELSEDAEHRLESKLPPGIYVVTVEGLDENGEWAPLAFSAAFEIAAHARTTFEIER